MDLGKNNIYSLAILYIHKFHIYIYFTCIYTGTYAVKREVRHPSDCDNCSSVPMISGGPSHKDATLDRRQNAEAWNRRSSWKDH